MNFHTFAILLPVLAVSLLIGCKEQQENHSGDSASHPHEMTTETVAGTVSGFDCAVVGALCPSTHRGADYTNGIYTEGEEFYFVVNIPQSFMTQYFLDELEITGTVYPSHRYSIEPEEIRLLDKGEEKLVYESGYFIDPRGHRAMFNEGRIEEGVWVCHNCAEETP